MDSDTLLTASTYLNNLLLARGLLRNGKAIDFAKPARETRAQIINLVHDLLLKRDRDEEHRERVADTLRTLRSESERKDADLERLRTRLADKERALVGAQAEARSARADLKRLQTSAKNTRTQLAKSKALSEQIKTQCLNDVRKRDAQIERLKTHIQGQQRGNKGLVVAPSISISSGSGSLRGGQSAFNASIHELQDPEYSLKQETTDFLTQLSQSLSDENDGLISLAQGTLHTLRQLLGVETNVAEATDGDEQVLEESAPAQPITHERLATELTSLLDTLSGLLTNPNFVSVDEVDIRDEEIARLRDGWEKMEARWKDVLLMMDGWRRRMERTGDTINLADLKMGLGLGAGFDEIKQAATSPSRLRPSMPVIHDISSPVPEPVSRDSGISGVDDKLAAVEPPDFFDLRPVTGQQLRQLSENIQSPRRVAFAAEEKQVSSVQTRSSKKRPSTSPPPTSRSSRRRSSDAAETEPPLSLADKLRLAASAAQEARHSPIVVAESSELELDIALPELEEDGDDVAALPRSPARKSKIKGRPRRRKSTLSPEELEGLLGLDE
ncbi:hypothetical protein ANO11243_044990 [Dothideomycetidae sp. 11243]|nr:hypothetical protein ANO11243_044990 [fungal sp. No.11243]